MSIDLVFDLNLIRDSGFEPNLSTLEAQEDLFNGHEFAENVQEAKRNVSNKSNSNSSSNNNTNSMSLALARVLQSRFHAFLQF